MPYSSEEGYDFLTTGENDTYYAPFWRYVRTSGIRARRSVVKFIEVPGRWLWRPTTRWRPLGLVVRHRRTGQYALFDHDDPEFLDRPGFGKLMLDPLCKAYFRSQYRPEANQGAPFDKVRPWTYIEYMPGACQSNVDRLRCVPRTQRRLFFKGKIGYGRRGGITKILNAQGVVDAAEIGKRTEYLDYLEACATHQLALALPGHANLCHREFEAFGIGTTVLMPRHRNQLHDPLIPNHHYVSVEVDAEGESAATIARAIAARYFQVRDQTDYLKFVAANAVAWYERNVRFPASLQMTARLIGLDRPRVGAAPFELVPRTP